MSNVGFRKMTEKEMYEGCLAADSKCQRALYEAYSPGVYALISRYVVQEDSAADVLQDTFIRVFDSIGRFAWRGNGSLRAWMSRIAVNMALDHLRGNGRLAVSSQPVDTVGDDVPDEPDASMVDMIDANMLNGFIAELPDGYRTVFNLFCIEGLSHRQIAERLGINEKSSSSQLARAKALLAKRIKQYLNEQYD